MALQSPLVAAPLALLGCVAVFAACSGSTPEPNPLPKSSAAPPASTLVPADSVAPLDSAEPLASASASVAPVASGPTSCPAGMALVDGDYCDEVEHSCLKEWYAKQNNKYVCEVFEEKSTCKGKKTKKRYCIDLYSWPNIKGERPEVMNNFYQAQVKCASVGKRMCTESEWTMACEGPEMKPFPYGYKRDANKCNGDHMWDQPDMDKVRKRDPGELARLWHGVRSGSQPQCISDYGVSDLPANNDEVVASETSRPAHRGKFDSVNTGGPWYKGVRNQCRPKIYTHDEGFYYYFLGFRCCGEPDGVATDPRTPKQIDRDWKFSHVERLARFSSRR